MAATGINGEDRLVQATFAAHLKDKLGWDTVYAFNDETFGSGGTLGRKDTTVRCSPAIFALHCSASIPICHPRPLTTCR